MLILTPLSTHASRSPFETLTHDRPSARIFAIADDVKGPYTSIGPVLTDRTEEWESGENGHASALVRNDELYLFYQARSQKELLATDNRWRYGIAVFAIADILKAVRREEKLSL